MKYMILRLAPGVCISVSLCVSAYSQGLYWESKTTIADSETTRSVSKVYYATGKFKVVPDKDDQTVILRLDKKLVIVVNQNSRTYAELTFSQWEAMMAQGKTMMVAMPPELQNLPDEEKKRILQQLTANGVAGKNPNIVVTKSTETKSISGYPCTKFVVKEDEKIAATVWASNALREFDVMRWDFREFSIQMALKNPMLRNFAEGMKSIEGFPLQTDIGDTKISVTKIERRYFDESDFDPPSEFRKTTPQLGE